MFSNLIRFYVSASLNRLILSFATLVLVEVSAIFFGTDELVWLTLFFIGFTGYSFQILGGVTAALLSTALVFWQADISPILASPVYLALGVGAGYVSRFIINNKRNHHLWMNMLMNQSKHLQVFREVSTIMQRTLQQDMLLKVILTSVTAGHGLGFNRAMIFLSSNESQSLKGIVGVGPIDVKRGYEVWEKISEDKLKLRDLIEHNFDSNFTDPELNGILRSLDIPLDGHNVFSLALSNQQPVIIKEIDESDSSQVLINRLFQTEEFAVIPLINQGKNIGILLIDNIVNKRPITLMDTENILPLANQAAIALDHANLYQQIEEMALRDGLTGLLNQRAFQTILDDHFPFNFGNQGPLSLIILDIDYFKIFNDKNGHLLGNEVLIKFAGVIDHSLRPGDFSFRFGGEEFVVLLPDSSLQHAEILAEAIRKNVEQASFPGEETQPDGTLTVSIGTACTDHPSINSKNELIEAADQALYKAKNSGKNTVVSFKEFVRID
ncbi:GGDEF domain-containing protein [Mesobacillus jeotgali]|uniref:GGDEF domain-containing protein n=1 Tax=Mesobacillus jeotgali TaxID=129985 RepID=UPI0009A72B51|nr:sensor domain-containing diguanylate cyclase [Mesobacillus jeotgali]